MAQTAAKEAIYQVCPPLAYARDFVVPEKPNENVRLISNEKTVPTRKPQNHPLIRNEIKKDK